MALFLVAYNTYVKPWEGNGVYAWLPDDKGGESYGGISRVANPNWVGWSAIDFEKHRLKVDRLKNGSKVAGMDGMVEQFYKDLWTSKGFDKLKNQDIANIVYDFMVNSGTGNVEKIVGPIVQAKKLSTIIDLLNTGDPIKTYTDIKKARIKFYKDIVIKTPAQEKFLDGWLNRINSFPNLTLASKIGLPVLLLFIVATVILLSIK